MSCRRVAAPGSRSRARRHTQREKLKAGDGVGVATSGALKLEGVDDAEVLLFDMAP